MQFSSEIFNKDISGYICNNHCDVSSLVAFAGTTKTNRVFVSEEINKQFNILLEYMSKATDTHDYPSILKRIHVKFIEIGPMVNTLEFKDSPELKSCINFTVFKEAFDLLKPFSHEIHFKENEVLNLDCPLLIKEMLSQDSDAEMWDPSNSDASENDKVNSIIKELKKLGLFEEGEPKDYKSKCPKGKTFASFFKYAGFNTCNDINIYLNVFNNFSVYNYSLKSLSVDNKWGNVNYLYKDKFVDFKFKDGNRVIPFSDRNKPTYEYIRIYAHAKELINSPNINNKYSFRYSTTLKDSYGNSEIVLCFNASGKEIKCIIPVKNLKSTEHFDSFVQEQLNKNYG